jgi:hypothetical protein
MNEAAFPVIPPLVGDVSASGYPYPEPGMTLRDYAAIHSSQPGVIEIVEVAGHKIDPSHRVYIKGEQPEGVSFNTWWISLGLEKQCELSALVRYAQADAMMKVREKN